MLKKLMLMISNFIESPAAPSAVRAASDFEQNIALTFNLEYTDASKHFLSAYLGTAWWAEKSKSESFVDSG